MHFLTKLVWFAPIYRGNQNYVTKSNVPYGLCFVCYTVWNTACWCWQHLRARPPCLTSRRVFNLVRVQSRCKIAGDREAGRNISENIFEAVLCRIVSAVRLHCSWWLRQQQAVFLELIPLAEAQQKGRLDSAHSPSSWRRFHWFVCCCWTESCLWYWSITGMFNSADVAGTLLY